MHRGSSINSTSLYRLGEFGCVYKGIWTQITAEKEKISDVVAVKTIKSMLTYVHIHVHI